MQAPTKDQLKERAKHLGELMLEKYSVKIKHGHSLEIISKLFGVKDWNTASALSAKASSEDPTSNALAATAGGKKPIATKFHTVGEIKEFLSEFEDGTKLVVNEYKWSELEPNAFGTLTSICSLTFDSEIQKENELSLELHTEVERNETHIGGSKSGSQKFEKTSAGRAQRRIKYMDMLSGFWNTSISRD